MILNKMSDINILNTRHGLDNILHFEVRRASGKEILILDTIDTDLYTLYTMPTRELKEIFDIIERENMWVTET